LLATKAVKTGDDGLARFDAPALTSGVITATATDANGNTSEFSCIPAVKVPLGGSASAPKSSCFRIYVPSKWGGNLTVGSTGAPPQGLKAADNSDYTSGTDFRDDKHGWFTFYVPAAATVTVSNTFAEDGLATTVPWNFWYFPFSSITGALHLYDPGGAYAHFDSKFSLGGAGLTWETTPANGHQTKVPSDWCGHCWGAALASIILEDPAAVAPFTQDELEGLSAELFNPALADPLFRAPFERPTTAATDASDRIVHRFHTALRRMLRTEGVPVHADLRQASGSGTVDEVWNQGCYEYKSDMQEEPAAKGNEDTEKILQVRHSTRFKCNDDFLVGLVSLSDPATSIYRREQQSDYTLIYKDDGNILPNGALAGVQQNWLTMTLTHHLGSDVSPPAPVFVPSCMFDVRSAAASFTATFMGTNPNVTGARLMSLGITKKPGF
jgi:hypothetical protein